MEAVTEFTYFGSKITLDCDCRLEIERCLLPEKKVMTNIDSILESRDITLLTKVRIVQTVVLGFPGGLEGKASACNAGDPGLIPGSGRSPGEGNGNPPQYPCLENPMDGGAGVGYSPWGHKESDMTER